MELCTCRAIISNLSRQTLLSSKNPRLLTPSPSRFNRTSIRRTNPGLVYFTNSSLRSASSEEASSGPSQYLGEEGEAATLEDLGKKWYAEFVQEKESGRDSFMDRLAAANELLENVDPKLARKYAFSALLVDAVLLIALGLAATVIGAIDSIPVFPEVMEVVGLSFTLWFSTRYLLFKENREELFAKIEEIKQKIEEIKQKVLG